MLKDAVDLSSLHRVLVIKLRHHGDVLLTAPVFSALKSRAPHLEIDALVYRDTAEMLTLHPAISQVHTIDRNWKRHGLLGQLRGELGLLSALRARHYDLVIHLTEHNRGAWLTSLLGARHGVAEKRHDKGPLWDIAFTHFHTPIGRGNVRHTVECNLDALRRIGIHPAPEERKVTLVPGAEAESFVEQKLAEHGLAGQPFIHIHPTSRWLFKCWPEANMAALIDALQGAGQRVVLTAAPDAAEAAMLGRIKGMLATPAVDLSGQLNLKQLAALAGRAKLFVGVDSAPMHIAAAMGTPTVALFGPSGDKEWGPWMVRHRIVTSDHACRPCGHDGCGGGKVSDCLATISVADVLVAVKEVMGDE
ncbi:MAG: putative lipopolysaccharide heptosyltransferase III [Sulfuricella sp.]|nr:putative lipopolysaccharide heptosyltransferase III [Sulfuricella sp.]